jgi:hypothetical protein
MNDKESREKNGDYCSGIPRDEVKQSKRRLQETYLEFQNKRLCLSETSSLKNRNDTNFRVKALNAIEPSGGLLPESDELLSNCYLSYEMKSYTMQKDDELGGIEIQHNQSMEDTNIGSLLFTSTMKNLNFDRSITASPAISFVDYDEVISSAMHPSPTTSQVSNEYG